MRKEAREKEAITSIKVKMILKRKELKKDRKFIMVDNLRDYGFSRDMYNSSDPCIIPGLQT